VQAHEADAAALARAGQTARRDVAGLRELVVRNEPPAPAPQDRPVADDPGKRVAAIVPGDSPYVATADGTRYFIGALLPTGHRVEAIEPHRVVLSRDGRESELDF
jgi:type III secretion protein D